MITGTEMASASIRDHVTVEAILSRADGHGDAEMASFLRTLLPSQAAEKVLNGFYTDAFHASLLRRLAAPRGSAVQDSRRRVSPLPKWKLRRVEAFVDANISERITLACLARCSVALHVPGFRPAYRRPGPCPAEGVVGTILRFE